jgi:hypothetical protein
VELFVELFLAEKRDPKFAGLIAKTPTEIELNEKLQIGSWELLKMSPFPV